MGRAKGSPAKPTRKRRRGRGRITLYILLVLIAVLLGVIVTLIPDSPDGGASQDVAVTGARSGADEDQGVPSDDAVPPEPAARDDSRTETPPPPTETYPEEEVPASVQGVPTEGAEDLWWLPDEDEFGGIRGVLYLILDDAGNNIEPLPAFLEFPGPLAVAVLPNLPFSVESAARTAAAGQEIMLHLPMEPVGTADPGPGALTEDLSDSDVLRILGENLASVPGAIGVNNHMGSRATSDERLMELVLADIRRRELFFVDSRTTVSTVASGIAANLHTQFAERDVFLDNDRSRDAILAAISGALKLAHSQDEVVMIGHATVAELAEVLNEIYPIVVERGYQFGRISDVVRVPVVPRGIN